MRFDRTRGPSVARHFARNVLREYCHWVATAGRFTRFEPTGFFSSGPISIAKCTNKHRPKTLETPEEVISQEVAVIPPEITRTLSHCNGNVGHHLSDVIFLKKKKVETKWRYIQAILLNKTSFSTFNWIWYSRVSRIGDVVLLCRTLYIIIILMVSGWLWFWFVTGNQIRGPRTKWAHKKSPIAFYFTFRRSSWKVVACRRLGDDGCVMSRLWVAKTIDWRSLWMSKTEQRVGRN